MVNQGKWESLCLYIMHEFSRFSTEVFIIGIKWRFSLTIVNLSGFFFEVKVPIFDLCLILKKALLLID